MRSRTNKKEESQTAVHHRRSKHLFRNLAQECCWGFDRVFRLFETWDPRDKVHLMRFPPMRPLHDFVSHEERNNKRDIDV